MLSHFLSEKCILCKLECRKWSKWEKNFKNWFFCRFPTLHKTHVRMDVTAIKQFLYNVCFCVQMQNRKIPKNSICKKKKKKRMWGRFFTWFHFCRRFRLLCCWSIGAILFVVWRPTTIDSSVAHLVHRYALEWRNWIFIKNIGFRSQVS